MKKLTILALATFMLSCNETKTPDEGTPETNPSAANNLNKLGWVLGGWYMETPDGSISEEWSKVNDSSYIGFGIMKTPKGDTVFIEQIKLLADAEGVWYMPTISGQNNGQEVKFKEITSGNDEIVFENLGHDFPQRIIYHRLTDSTMIASIEGEQNSKMRKEEYNYKRK